MNHHHSGCAEAALSGAPAGCAAIIRTASALIAGGQEELGRAMLKDLLHIVQTTGCGKRPECRPLIREVAKLLKE